MAKVFNWGIIGCGKIAHKFAKDIQVLKSAKLHAVASRTKDKALAFGKGYDVEHCYGSYEEMLLCPKLDVIYIATPHVTHCANTIMCLNGKIPVLCEKPFAMNAVEVRRMVAASKKNDTFLMEALWTRFLPTIKKTLSIIERGTIGEIQTIKADFGFRASAGAAGRLFDQNLGGGALLDVGIYPVFLSLLLLGKPVDIKAIANIGKTNVDENCAMLFKYPENKMAVLDCSIVTKTASEALIYGTKGTIRINSRWHEPTSMTVLMDGKEPKDYFFDFESNGYSYEIEEVQRCLRANKQSSDLLSHHFSLDLIELLDEIRRIAGIHYPNNDGYTKLPQSKSDSNFFLN
ncbi:MAG: putative dehydrogenase [Saprospiraceae bacterium]|jgi:predicted dehydrogenase